MDLDANFQHIARKVDPVIKKLLALGAENKTRKLLFYQIETGGKRLRPCLAILCCFACGGKVQDVLEAAAGLEILHTYSLIIDDIIDHSDKRRGKLTTWRKFGRSFAECVGMDYGASLLEAAARTSKPQLIARIFARTIKKIVEGEILDILFEQSGRVDEPYATTHRFGKITLQDYLGMAEKKTAFLFESSCEIGALMPKAPRRKILALKQYGRNVGIAFQITDDILDIYGTQEFGKPLGQDIRERKLGNILIFFALQELPFEKRTEVRRILTKRVITNSDVKRVSSYIQKTHGKERALALAQMYIRRAKKNLVPLGLTPHRNALEQLADVIQRREK